MCVLWVAVCNVLHVYVCCCIYSSLYRQVRTGGEWEGKEGEGRRGRGGEGGSEGEKEGERGKGERKGGRGL